MFKTLLAGAVMIAGPLCVTAPTQRADAAQTIEVALGRHQFATRSPADGVVARVAAGDVGWVEPSEGAAFGPGSFEIAADGGVWLLDGVKDRLLGWAPGQPDRLAWTVPVPTAPVDFALGPGGTFYVSRYPAGQGPSLAALNSDGTVRWQAARATTNFNNSLRIGPDGVLYDVEPGAPEIWRPVVGADGVARTVAQQNLHQLAYQPLPGENRLLMSAVSAHEIRVALRTATNRPVRTWRITSDTEIAPRLTLAGLSGGDPVVTLDVADWTRADPASRLEQIALRLTPTGASAQLNLDSVLFGDDAITEYRVGPDGAFYQMETSRQAGVKILRYLLGAPASSPSPTATSPTPPTTPTTPSTAVPTAAAAAGSPSRAWLVWIAGLAGLLAMFGAGVLLLRRRRG